VLTTLLIFTRWIIPTKNGITVFWDTKSLRSVYNTPIAAPAFVLDHLPRSTNFEGELWVPKSFRYEMLSDESHEDWKLCKMNILDAPLLRDVLYEERLLSLEKSIIIIHT
jgi:hypothetical protein